MKGKCVRCNHETDKQFRFAEDVDDEGRPEPGPWEFCHFECYEEIVADQK